MTTIAERIQQTTGATNVQVREDASGEAAWWVQMKSPLGVRVIEQRLNAAGFEAFDCVAGGHNMRFVFLNERSIDDITCDITERAMEITWRGASEPTFSIGERVSVKHDLRYFDLTEGGSSAIALHEAQAGVIVSIPRVDKPVVRFDEGNIAYQWPIPAEWLRRVESVDAPDAWVPEPVEGGVIADDDESTTWIVVRDGVRVAVGDTVTRAFGNGLYVIEAVEDEYAILKNTQTGIIETCFCDDLALPAADAEPMADARAGMPTVWASEHSAVVAERDAYKRTLELIAARVSALPTAGWIGDTATMTRSDCYKAGWQDARYAEAKALRTLLEKVQL